MSSNLNPTKALIFRITHRDNIPWILKNGLHCKNSNKSDPSFVSIGNQELIDKRNHRRVECAPWGTLSDYVPFYFTPFSPMMYNIKTGRGVKQRDNEQIVILASSLPSLEKKSVPFVFTDRHAYLEAAQFSSDLTDLDWIDWPSLQIRDFKRDPEDPTKFERYQAEALVHRRMPAEALLGVACCNAQVEATLKAHIARCRLDLPVKIIPGWYF